MDFKKEIGERLRHARDKSDIKQNRAAMYIGVHNSTLNKYESGDREADHETMVRLSELYHVNLHWLLTGEGDMYISETATDLLKTERQMKNADSMREQSTDTETNIGRAFFGGSDKYSEEELEIARAAAKAAIEAFRKVKKQQ
jgi:transcriptional regulator with XRE-family HTH domain